VSIVASVKVHDGIAIGADAMSTILGRDAQGNVGVVKTYEHAEKLFRLGQTPIGVAVYGIGNIGPRSIGSFIHEFGKKLTEPEDVEKVAADLLAFLRSQYDAQLRDVAQVPAEQRPQLGVLIAGYSPNEPLADEWEFVIPFDQTPRRVRPPGTFGADWRGVSVPFTRLYVGFDPNLPGALAQAGVPADVVQRVMEVAQTTALPIVFDGMPLQDAIDCLAFILRTTVSAARFTAGSASCGGALSIAVIDREHAFRWIKKPDLGFD